MDDAKPTNQRGACINDQGRIVACSGGASTRTSWYSDARSPNSRLYLELPGWVSANAQRINNNDWIVGYGDAPAAGADARGLIINPPPGDADHDGDVDLDDCAQFAACLSGPKGDAGASPPTETCLRAFDFAPADDDVDSEDFARLNRAFAGE